MSTTSDRQNVPRHIILKPAADSAILVPLGDLHIGSRHFDPAALKRVIQYCLTNRAYVLGMGDLINANLRNSKGSVWEDNLTPQQQFDTAYEYLAPLATEGLLLGLIQGNHDVRIDKESGLNFIGLIAEKLGVPDLGPSASLTIRFPESSFNIFASHGSGGGGTAASKTSKLEKLAQLAPTSDIILIGHVHADNSFSSQVFVHKNTGGMGVATRYHFVCGSFQRWAGYAQAFNLIPNRLGTWALTLTPRQNSHDRKTVTSIWIS